MSLSGLKDIDREILKYVTDEELLKVCSINRKTWKEVCDDNFLRRRLSRYLDIEDYKFKDETWKTFFSRFVHYKFKLSQHNFTYISGNFMKKFHTIRNYSKDYMLIRAITDGDLELAKFALKAENANINTGEECALRIDAEHVYVDIVRWLMEQGSNIHAENEAALNAACKNGHFEIVKLFVSAGANIHISGDYPLHSAVYQGYLDVVRYLVEIGANLNTGNNLALTLACKINHFEIVKYLIQAGSNICNQALTYAFSLENPEIYNYLMTYEFLVRH